MAIDDIILDMSKTLILEYIDVSRHNENNDLKQFILDDIPFNEAVSIAWNGEVLTEANYVQTQDKVNKLRSFITPYLNMPLYSFFNKHVTKRITKSLNTKLLSKISKPMLKNFLGTSASIFVTAPLASYGMSLATKLLSSMVYDKIVRANDDCKDKCKASTNKKSPIYHELVLVCANRCRIANFTRLLSELKAQKTNCAKTDSPLLCERNMLQQMIKIKGMKDKEVKILQKNIQRLNKVKSKRLHIKVGL